MRLCCPFPMRVFEAFHWPWDQMISFRASHRSTFPPFLTPTQLMDPTSVALKQGVLTNCTCGSSMRVRCSNHGMSLRGAWKTWICSGLDSLTVSWSLKNKELFPTGLMDRPRVRGVPLMDCPRVEPLKQGVVPDWTCVEPLKQGGFPNRTQIFCLVFF